MGGWRPPAATSPSGAGGRSLVAAGVVLLAVLPDVGDGAGGLPGELVWSFRLSSLAAQVMLWGGTAVAFGLLGTRERAPE